MPGNSDM